GPGRSWPDAFHATFGQPVEQFHAEYPATLPGRFPASIPAAGRPGTVFHLVIAGLQPREPWRAEVVWPDGTRASASSPTAGEAGAVNISFDTPSIAPVGTWRLTVTGEQGSRATVTFRTE